VAIFIKRGKAMTQQEYNDFWEKVKGKKIKKHFWNDIYIIPQKFDQNGIYGFKYDSSRNYIEMECQCDSGNYKKNSEECKKCSKNQPFLDFVYICQGFNKDDFGDYWEFYKETKLSKLFTLTKNYATDLINLFRN
jgi:hypothetical protein